jgi:hypothetical protein
MRRIILLCLLLLPDVVLATAVTLNGVEARPLRGRDGEWIEIRLRLRADTAEPIGLRLEVALRARAAPGGWRFLATSLRLPCPEPGREHVLHYYIPAALVRSQGLDSRLEHWLVRYQIGEAAEQVAFARTLADEAVRGTFVRAVWEQAEATRGWLWPAYRVPLVFWSFEPPVNHPLTMDP